MDGDAGWLRRVLPLALVSFLVSVGFAAVNLILPYYLLALAGLLNRPPDILSRVETDEIALEFGMLISAFMATRAVLAYFAGALSDAFGRKPLILLGLGLYTLTGLLYALATSFEQLLALRALQGVASALVWPVAETLLVELVPPLYRARALSAYVMSMQLGHILGPLVGVAAYLAAKSLVDGDVMTLLRAPFIILAVFMFAGLVAGLAVPETLRERRGFSRREALGLFGFLGELPSVVKRSALALLANSGINGFVMGIFTSIVLVYVMEHVTANMLVLGLVMAAASITGIILVAPLMRRIDRLRLEAKKRLLVVVAALARTTIILVAFATSIYELFIAMLLSQASFYILMPVLRVLQAELLPPEKRGALFGAQQALFNAGMIIGPAVGGWLYRAWADVTLGPVTGQQLIFILAMLLGYIGVAVIALLYEPVSYEQAKTLEGAFSQRQASASAARDDRDAGAQV